MKQIEIGGTIDALNMLIDEWEMLPVRQDPNPTADPNIDERFWLEIVTNDSVPDPPPDREARPCATCERLGVDYCIKPKGAALNKIGIEFDVDMEEVFAAIDDILEQGANNEQDLQKT